MQKTTQELLDILQSSNSIQSYFKEDSDNLVQERLCDYLQHLLQEKALSISDIIQRSGLPRTYTYEILRGSKKPSRDKVLTICLALSLTLEETQTLLKHTGYPPLYPRLERDCVLIFSLQHALSVTDTNELLYELGYEILT